MSQTPTNLTESKVVVALKPKAKVSKGKASAQQLRELHRLFSQAMFDYMVNTPIGEHKPAMLNIVRVFLNDNGVEHSSSVEALELLRKGLAEENPVANLASFTVPF
jgi:hypothetical protein